MYLNLIELAESFGVAEKVVEDWIRNEQLPHVLDRGRLLFDRARVVDWAAVHGLTARTGFLAPETGAYATGLALAPMLRTGGIWRDVPAAGISDVLQRALAALPGVPHPVRTLLSQRLRAKKSINWAPVGHGFALPHFQARVALGREAGVIALVLLREPLPLIEEPPDDEAVRFLLFFMPPSPRAHLDMLARLSRGVAGGPLPDLVRGGAPDEELLKAVAALDARVGGKADDA